MIVVYKVANILDNNQTLKFDVSGCLAREYKGKSHGQNLTSLDF